jgi:hypothetical protein
MVTLQAKETIDLIVISSEPDLDELFTHSAGQEHAGLGDDARDEVRRRVVHSILHARER